MSEAPSAIDARALIDLVRRGDPQALKDAYQRTFANDLGRLVLAHHLADCGVGNLLGPDGLEYRAGMHDGALKLAAMAAFDQASIAVGVLTDTLEEGLNHETQEFAFYAGTHDEID